MVQVDLFPLVGKIACEAYVEEFLKHGVVHAGCPAVVGSEPMFQIGGTPPDTFHDGGIP